MKSRIGGGTEIECTPWTTERTMLGKSGKELIAGTDTDGRHGPYLSSMCPGPKYLIYSRVRLYVPIFHLGGGTVPMDLVPMNGGEHNLLTGK